MMNMSETDAQNFHTAYVLHEEITNSISLVKQNIEEARRNASHSNSCLNNCVEELDHLTATITTLSDKLAPAIFDGENYRSHIEKLVQEFERKEKTAVRLLFSGSPGDLKHEKGLVIYRIMQDLLRFASQSGSENTSLNIHANSDFDITFEYDTKKLMMENQKMLLQDNIMSRVEILKGQFEKNRFDSGETRIHINIPASGN